MTPISERDYMKDTEILTQITDDEGYDFGTSYKGRIEGIDTESKLARIIVYPFIALKIFFELCFALFFLVLLIAVVFGIGWYIFDAIF